MARVESVKVQLSCTGLEDAKASLESLASVLDPAGPKVEAEHLLAEFIANLRVGADDGGNICRFETLADAAGGTLELVSIKVLPSDRFLELMTAIAGERDDVSFVLRHGWPILSVGRVAAPTVAEAGGESIAPGGGPA
jgi:hypothetical protein